MSKFIPEKWTKPYPIKDRLYVVYALKPFNGRYRMREVVNLSPFYTIKTNKSVVFKDLPEGAQKDIKKSKEQIDHGYFNILEMLKALNEFNVFKGDCDFTEL